jgi:NitT/TauT family transport system ATP-binding protein
MNSSIVEASHLTKSYPDATGRSQVVVEDVSLRVQDGEWFALLGQSGSGKSTILRCLIGLAPPSKGEVRCRGRPFVGVHPEASMVFQTFALFPWLTVEQNIGVALLSRNLSRSKRKEAVHAAIELIGLSHYHTAYPRELSCGMRQRVAIGRALVSEPGLLFLDEAFSGLDVLTGENLRQEMLGLWHRKDTSLKSVFMVTHTIEEAVETATRIGVLFPNPGRLGLVLENPLPYPRDPQSEEFRKLVASIHETITKQCLPDVPVHPAGGGAERPFHPAEEPVIQAIPQVPPGQILGLLSILEDATPGATVYALSNLLGLEFGAFIGLVTAAELLGFVETPGNEVCLTELGLRFHSAHREQRRMLFAAQLRQLGLFRYVLELLGSKGPLEEGRVLEKISAALPYENAGRLLHTLVAWGRYAGLLDYDTTMRRLLLIGEGSGAGS